MRNERNLAREEIKQLQTKLDNAIKESNTNRRQKQNLEVHNEQMRKELEQIHLLLLKHVGTNVFFFPSGNLFFPNFYYSRSISFTGQWDIQLADAIQKVETVKDNPCSYFGGSEEHPEINGKDSGIEEYILNDSLMNRHSGEVISDLSTCRASSVEDTLSNVSELSIDIRHDELLRHKLSETQLKLDEMTKTVVVERE